MFVPSRRVTRLWYKKDQYHALIWYVLRLFVYQWLTWLIVKMEMYRVSLPLDSCFAWSCEFLFNNLSFDFHWQPSFSLCSFIPRPRGWPNWTIDNLSFLFLAIVMCTDQTSQILWQHHQGCPRGSWVLQGCLLWTWLPDIPQGKCSNEPLQKCGTVKHRILKNLWDYDLHRILFWLRILQVHML